MYLNKNGEELGFSWNTADEVLAECS